jgi:hypothetical protein
VARRRELWGSNGAGGGERAVEWAASVRRCDTSGDREGTAGRSGDSIGARRVSEVLPVGSAAKSSFRLGAASGPLEALGNVSGCHEVS